jgi:hypothetical protein
VLQGSTFTLEGDIVELFGGSNKYSWDIEDGDINAELSFSVSEYPNWLFELFGGKAPTQGAAEPSGNVSTLTDKYGSSVVAAAGLLGTITVSTAANLKTGKYVVKATATDAFKVYALSDADFGRGASLDFVDDTMEVGSFTGVTGSGSTHVLTALGITFTTGASPAAFTSGDTATFEIRAINTYNRVVKIGGIADFTPEFSAMVYAQKSGKGTIFEIEIFRLKASGLTLGAERKAYSQNDYTAKAAYDSLKDGLCSIREVQ